MKKILLTGAAGQVGQAVVRLAAQYPVDLVAFPRALLDITDEAQVLALLTEHRPDFVFNAAAFTAVDLAESEVDAAFAINALGARHLAKACAALNIPLVHLSTDYIFDGTKASAYVESDPANPQGVYGASKWQGEQEIRALCPKHFIIRVSWVFGSDGANFVKTILRLSAARDTLSIVADQKGCPTSADSIAHLLFQLALKNSPLFGTYHFCNSAVTTWYEFAEAIVAQAKLRAPLRVESILPINTEDYPTPAQRPKNSELDCHLLERVLGFTLPAWRDELRLVIQALVDIQ